MKRIDQVGEKKTIDISKLEVNKFKEWKNASTKTISAIKCIIPAKIYDVMFSLSMDFQKYEFSIFCNSNIINNDEKIIHLEEKFYIPHQEVTPAFVDYKEGSPPEFNTVIHKHPSGISSFSSTDREYINQNFDYSILWMDGKFVTGQARVVTQFGYVAVPLTITTQINTMDIDTSKIKIYKPPQKETQVLPDISAFLSDGKMFENEYMKSFLSGTDEES